MLIGSEGRFCVAVKDNLEFYYFTAFYQVLRAYQHMLLNWPFNIFHLYAVIST